VHFSTIARWRAQGFPRPKKFPGCAINFWTDDQIDDHYSTLEGDDDHSNKPKAGRLREA
jgi:hypothetical protein